MGESGQGKQVKTVTPRLILQLLVGIVLLPLLPLILSGRWDWWAAWAYAFIYIAGFISSRFLAVKRHPDILQERARFARHENAQSWDKKLAPLAGLGGGVLVLVAGLDARWGWTAVPIPRSVLLLGLGLLLTGYALGTWALIENRFFSGVVRIQQERGHHVISSGPYRWLRHPGYAGAILSYLGTPLFLTSLWSLIPALLLTAVLVLRTSLEDRFLQDALPGYPAYSRQVRYRLLPGVW